MHKKIKLKTKKGIGKNMLAENCEIDLITKVTGLIKEEIESLK